MRKHLDISAYLVIGPENTMGRPVEEILGAAVAAGAASPPQAVSIAQAKSPMIAVFFM